MLGIEYQGTKYHGWQKQDGLITIQESVELALSKIANAPIEIVCAGRTDAGVHAVEQVVHFDTQSIRAMHAWVFGGNHNLPKDIRIQWAKPVDETFHARFSALCRTYRYLIFNHKVPSALLRDRVTFYPLHYLQENLMQEAAQYLIGEHDFSAFRGSSCQSHSPKRNVIEISIIRQEHLITIDITANAFLQHMVRNIVGVLLEIGAAKRPPVWTQEVLLSRDRSLAGITAHPEGLYLYKVDY